MKKLLLLIPITAIFVICYFLNLEPSKAQNFTSVLKSEKPQNLTSVLSAKSIKEKNFNELIESAERTGKVRVIVGVKIESNIGDESFLQNIDSVKEEIKTAQNRFINQLSAYDLKYVKYDYIPYLAMSVNASALRAMRDLPDVASIEEDEMLYPSLTETIGMIGTPAAWSAGYSGVGQTVAIIDSGVDKTHPMFSGKIVSEACYSAYDGVNAFYTCNGVLGTNPYPGPGEPSFMAASTAINSGLPCNPNGISSLIGGCAHGTHVAGIAAGRTTNFSGVARDSGIIAINAGSVILANGNYRITYFNSALLLALERVFALRTTFNIAAVNMSLGGSRFFANCDTALPAIKGAIDNLRSAGIATVIASGNEEYTDSIAFPACISSAVSVGSVGDGSISGFYPGFSTVADRVSPFSNSASFLNLLAPGDGVVSSVPAFVSSSGYANFGGTSMAAPHVAGSWAVLKQRVPTATVPQVLNALTTTGQPITDFRNGIVKPRIRVNVALQSLGGCPAATSISIGQTVNGTLQGGDCVLASDGSYYDAYTFSGTAGQQIFISMNSAQFDTYLFLIQGNYPGGSSIASDNNGGGGTNSRIPATSGLFTLPATGTYTILANSFNPGVSGAYSLTLGTGTSCSYSVSPNVHNFGAFGGGGLITISAQTGCPWTVTSNVGWMTTTSTPSGTGNGSVTFTVFVNTGAARTGTLTIANQTVTVNQAAGSQPTAMGKHFDYDGDRKTDIGIFRPSNGQWWHLRSSDSGSRAVQFGTSTDIRVPADFTGDGKVDTAFFRPSTGQWFVLRSENNSFYGFQFGQSGDIPATGDFDRDGKADAAIFRPSNGGWYILLANGGVVSQQFGISEDKPVIADYDGDGKDDIAVFRPSSSQWWILKSSGGVMAAQFGATGDKTVQGDYTGDGKADIAFWRPSNGTWYILRSEDSSFYGFPFGINGDIPAPGDYDGDSKFDAAVYRPSNSAFYLQRSTSGFQAVSFGTSGDQPIAAAYVR